MDAANNTNKATNYQDSKIDSSFSDRVVRQDSEREAMQRFLADAASRFHESRKASTWTDNNGNLSVTGWEITHKDISIQKYDQNSREFEERWGSMSQILDEEGKLWFYHEERYERGGPGRPVEEGSFKNMFGDSIPHSQNKMKELQDIIVWSFQNGSYKLIIEH